MSKIDISFLDTSIFRKIRPNPKDDKSSLIIRQILCQMADYLVKKTHLKKKGAQNYPYRSTCILDESIFPQELPQCPKIVGFYVKWTIIDVKLDRYS